MWKVYKWDGHHIRGELISSHTTEAAALKKAKKEFLQAHQTLLTKKK